MSRGQASIELLIIALAMLAASILVLSHYTSINDSTTAIELLKVHVLGKAPELEGFAYIEKIDYRVSGNTINLGLYMKSDSTIAPADLELDSVESEIVENTAFETAAVTLHQ